MRELRFTIKGPRTTALPRKAGDRRGLGLTITLLIAVAALPQPAPVSNGLERIQLIPNGIAFSDQLLGTRGPELLVRLKNLSSTEVHPSIQGITGMHASDFELASSDCAVVLPNEECDIRVTFYPQAPGLRSAILKVAPSDNSAVESAVTLQGNAVDVPLTPPPVLSVEPLFLSFDPLPVGQTSRPMSVRLINVGQGSLHIDRIALASNHFALSSGNCLHRDLGAGEFCDLGLVFAPRQAGPLESDLTVEVPPPASSLQVNLRGTGWLQIVSVVPDSLAFGSWEQNGVSEAQLVTVKNEGNTQIRVGRILLAGHDARSFGVTDDGCQGKSLAPKESCTLQAHFAPLSTGVATAALSILDRDSATLGGVRLSGLGTARAAPEIEVAPLALDFSPPSPARQGALVRNTGSAPLRIESLAVRGPNEKAFRATSSGCQAPVLPGDHCTIQVELVDPASTKPARSAEVLIGHNAPAGPAAIRLDWKNVRPPTPRLTAEPQLLDFGEVTLQSAQNLSRPQRLPVMFTNAGSVAVQGIHLMIGAPWSNQKAFAVESNGCSAGLDIQAQCAIVVSFTPREALDYNRTLTVLDKNLATLARVELRGKGVLPPHIGRKAPVQPEPAPVTIK